MNHSSKNLPADISWSPLSTISSHGRSAVHQKSPDAATSLAQDLTWPSLSSLSGHSPSLSRSRDNGSHVQSQSPVLEEQRFERSPNWSPWLESPRVHNSASPSSSTGIVPSLKHALAPSETATPNKRQRRSTTQEGSVTSRLSTRGRTPVKRVKTGLRLHTIGSEGRLVNAPKTRTDKSTPSIHHSKALPSQQNSSSPESGCSTRTLESLHSCSPIMPRSPVMRDMSTPRTSERPTGCNVQSSNPKAHVTPTLSPVGTRSNLGPPMWDSSYDQQVRSPSTEQAPPTRNSPLSKYAKSIQAQRQDAQTPPGSTTMSSQDTWNPLPKGSSKHRLLPNQDSYPGLEEPRPAETYTPKVDEEANTASKTAHILQLELYATCIERHSTSQRNRSKKTHNVYQLLFLASVMHSMYRPPEVDPQVLLLTVLHEQEIPQLQAKWSDEPPTRVLGLLPADHPDSTALIWGRIDRTGPHKLVVHLSACIYPLELSNKQELTRMLSTAAFLVERTMGGLYKKIFPKPDMVWSEHKPRWTPEESYSYFCQLISTVVHEQPPPRAGTREHPMVQPTWPVDLVQEKVELLLQQLTADELTVQAVAQSGSLVPQCVYLHGSLIPFYGVRDQELESLYEENAQLNQFEDVAARNQNRPSVEIQANPSLAGIKILDMAQMYLKHHRRCVTFQANTPTDRSFSCDSDTGNISFDLIKKRRLIRETLEEFHAHRGHSPPARLAFWQQFRNCTPSVDAVAFVTTHLWLSALTGNPWANIMYIDPVLAADLVQRSDDDALPSNPEDIPTLWGRQKLWPMMPPDAHVLVLAQLTGLSRRGEVGWVMIHVRVLDGVAEGMEVLMPPSDGVNHQVINRFIGLLIGQLNAILPRPSLLQGSTAVERCLKTLVMPASSTEEMSLMVIIAHLCGRFLGDDVFAVDVPCFRQNLCYFINTELTKPDLEDAYHWNGLLGQDLQLLTTTSSPEVSRRRLSLASNREPSPFDAFARRKSYSAPLVSSGSSTPFFAELALPETTFPEDMLVGTSGRSVQDLEDAIFLGRYESWPRKFADKRLQHPNALSLDEYHELVYSLGGPKSAAARPLLLTGAHEGKRVRLDWLKDAPHLEKDWLMASTDVDSLTLTTQEAPLFTQSGSYYPYPSRAMSLTVDNNLKVNVAGREIGLHTCPNFCIMTFGANNQFRLLIFFPNCRQTVPGKMWRNFPKEIEMSDWYHIFLTALRMVAAEVAEEWRHAVEKTIEALPINYAAAARRCNPGGSPRSFLGHRIEPHVLNLTLAKAREIVDTEPRFAQYRQYLFHLCGINLKLSTQNIHGREDQSPLNYVFRVNNFIDWYAQNPNNIAVDVGLAINVDRRRAPEALKSSTLLLRYHALKALLELGYQQPQEDRFCHSSVIGGARSHPRRKVATRAGISKFHAYLKLMILHYIHQGRSIGANFTVAEALGLGHRKKFAQEMEGFRQLLRWADAYGIRFEWRLSPWAANRLMLYSPRDIMERLFDAGVIVCHPTATVVNHMVLWSQGWSAILDAQCALSKPVKERHEVKLLASVLAYWLKGLVKRPDDMSASVEMANLLDLLSRAERYGLPSLRSGVLLLDHLRVSYIVGPDSFKILRHTRVIRPGGQKLKSSRLSPEPAEGIIAPPNNPAGPSQRSNGRRPVVSETFLEELLTMLPMALWDRFPNDRKAQGSAARRLRLRPLKHGNWAKMVEPLNGTVMTDGDFNTTFNILFPPNWTAPKKYSEYKNYDREFLSLIRAHVETIAADRRPAYSDVLRSSIKQALRNDWDFLPAARANKIWVLDPHSGSQQMYRLVSTN